MKLVLITLLIVILIVAGCNNSPSVSNHESLHIKYPQPGISMTGWDSIVVGGSNIEPVDNIQFFVGDSVILRNHQGLRLPMKLTINTELYPSDLHSISCRIYSHQTYHINGEIIEKLVTYDSDTVEVEFDNSPPNKIGSLEILDSTYNSLTIGWRSPGDNDSVGQASAYDIRFRTWEITNSNFKLSDSVDSIISPAPSGQQQSITISGLSADHRYYVAVKSSDEGGNKSDISNIVSTTTEPIFAEPVIYPTSDAIRQIFAGDYDNDLDMDVAVIQGYTKMFIYLNDGAGNFTLGYTGDMPYSLYDVVSGDLDNVNGPDFVLSIRYGSAGWPDSTRMISWLNDGSGNFDQRLVFDNTHLLHFTLINFNGDEYVDMIGEVNGKSRISIFQGRGDGTFDISYFDDPSVTGVFRTTGGDVNGDGYDDIMILTYGNKYLLINDRNGSLLDPIPLSGYFDAEWLHSGDINSDGLSDLVILGDYNGVRVYLSDGVGLMPPISLSARYPLSAHTLDIDMDGHCDLVIGSLSDDNCSIHINKSQDSLQFFLRSSVITPSDSYRFAYADFDGDGDPDMVAAFQRFGYGFGYYENKMINAK